MLLFLGQSLGLGVLRERRMVACAVPIRHSSFCLALLALSRAILPPLARRTDRPRLPFARLLLIFNAGHCKKLAPEYEILGGRFSKDKDDVMIAKVCQRGGRHSYITMQ